MSEKLATQPVMSSPSKFSFREEALDLVVQDERKRIYTDQATGERFYKLDRMGAERQKLVALVLKDVVNVSDVVKVGEDFYSHIQDFDKLDASDENVLVEAQADMFILSRLFKDEDHNYNPLLENMFSVLDGVPKEHQNLYIEASSNKLNFFDFDYSKVGHLINRLIDKNYITDIVESTQYEFNKRIKSTKTESSALLRVLQDKVGKLIEMFKDDQKDVFKKKVKRSELGLNDEQQETMFINIQFLLSVMKKALIEIK